MPEINRHYYTQANHTTVSITSASVQVVASNPSRSYLIIANNTDTTVWLSLGTVSTAEKGIPLFANGSAYEISSQFGNLFQGVINASVSGTVSKTIQVVEGSGV